MVDQSISMNVNDTLELDYLVEEVSDSVVSFNKNPNGKSDTYVSRNSYIFDPNGTGTYEFELNGQIIEVEVTDIPDSVVYQYPFSTFTTSTWADDVGSADMTVYGMVTDTFSNGSDSVFADGNDDYGLANGPQTLPENQTFGLAFTTQYTSTNDFEVFFGSRDVSTTSRISTGTFSGGIRILIQDSNGNIIAKYTDSAFNDGTPHAVVINKSGNSVNDIDIYVDDMATAQSDTNDYSDAFDNTNYSNAIDMGFYARNNGGSIDNYLSHHSGVFEFNTQTYSQSEREDFASRRPEI